MDELKPTLVDRHNAWEEGHARGASLPHTRSPQPPPSSYDGDRRHRSQAPSRKASMVEQNGEEKRVWYPDLSTDRRRYDELTIPSPQPKSRSPRSRLEHEGILNRQREAEDESRMARRVNPYSNNPSPYAQPNYPPLPSPGAVTPQRTASHASSNGTTSSLDPPPLLPLESPNRKYDGESTDTENDYHDDDRLYKRVADLTLGSDGSTPFGG